MKTSSTGPHDEVSRAVLTVPNVISLVRLSSVPIFMWLFIGRREEWAVIVYGTGAFTDFLDGYVARRTGAISELGKLLDPLADRIFIVALAVALVVRGSLPAWLAVVVIARDLILLSLWPLLERRRVQRIPVNAVGKAATAALLFGLTWLALGETDFAWGSIGQEVGLTSVGVGATLYWAAAVAYGQEALMRLRAQTQEGTG
ncbi:CDP-alcohol phosphatidyltransferase family protein [soil metagenome]